MSLGIHSIHFPSAISAAEDNNIGGGSSNNPNAPAMNVFQTADQFFDHYVNARSLANFQTHLLNKIENSALLRLLADYVMRLIDDDSQLEELVACKNALLRHLRWESPHVLQQLQLWPQMLTHNDDRARDFVPVFVMDAALPAALVTLQPNDRNTTALLVGVRDQPALFDRGHNNNSELMMKQAMERLMAVEQHIVEPHFGDGDAPRQAEFLWNSLLANTLLQLQQHVRRRINLLRMGHVDGTRTPDENSVLALLEKPLRNERQNLAKLYNTMYQRHVVEAWNEHRPEWQPLRQMLMKQFSTSPTWTVLSFADAVTLYYQRTYSSVVPPNVRAFYQQMMTLHTTLMSQSRPTHVPQLRLQIDSLQVSGNYVKDAVLVEAARLWRVQCWLPMLELQQRAVELAENKLTEHVLLPFRQTTSPLEVLQRCPQFDDDDGQTANRQNLLVSMNAVLPLLLQQLRPGKGSKRANLAQYMTSMNRKLWLVVAPNNYLDMLRCDPTICSGANVALYTFSPLPEQLEKMNVLLNACVWQFLRPLADSGTVDGETASNMMESLKSLLVVDLSMFMSQDVYLPSVVLSSNLNELNMPSTAHLLPRRVLFPRDMSFVDEQERFMDSTNPMVSVFYVTGTLKLGNFATRVFWTPQR